MKVKETGKNSKFAEYEQLQADSQVHLDDTAGTRSRSNSIAVTAIGAAAVAVLLCGFTIYNFVSAQNMPMTAITEAFKRATGG